MTLALLLFAQLTSTSTDATIPDVEARAARIREGADPTVTASEITPARLKAARRRGESPADLLDTIAGARALDLGGPLGDRRLTLRGGAPSQVITVVDGVAYGTSFATGVDVGFLHEETIESMRVVRGGQGALLGDGALTGALLITSRRPTDRPVESASLQYGSASTLRAGASAAFAPVAVSASYEQSEGDFTYEDRAFGLQPVTRTRRNNDARRGAVTLTGAHAFGDNVARFSLLGSFRDAGVPGLTSDENLEAREARRSLLGRVANEHQRGHLRLTTSLQAAYLRIGYEDPAQRIDTVSDFLTARAETALQLQLGANVLRLLGMAGGEIADSTEHGSPTRLRTALALSDEHAFGDFTLFAAGRLVTVTGQRWTLLPRLGLRFDPTEYLGLRVGIGRSLRTPTIDELYRPSQAGLTGNPNLTAETAWEMEVAASLDWEGLTAAVTGFARQIDDVILYVNRNAFEIRPENLGEARALGSELELSYQRVVGPITLSGYANLGLLLSELTTTKERLPTQPVWNFSGNVEARHRWLSVFSHVRWFGPTSTRVGSDLEANRVPAYVRWDVGLETQPLDFFSISLRCLNLLDRRDLQSVNKIPLPGRTFFVALRVDG